MGFKAKEFKAAAFEHRTATLGQKELPGLADFFDDEIAWTVRGLTFDEIRKCQEIAGTGRDILEALAKTISDPKKGRAVEGLKSAMGMGKDTHRDTALRMEHLVTCSVEPAIDNHIAAKLAQAYPTEFAALTNKILELTGLGQVIGGKSKASTPTPKSEAV